MDKLDSIKKNIKKIIENGITKLAIYPYGMIGKKIEEILKILYNIEVIYRFDQDYKTNNKILDPKEIKNIKEDDLYFLVATVKLEVQNQVIYSLLNAGINDTHIIKVYDVSSKFIDNRISQDHYMHMDLYKNKSISIKKDSTQLNKRIIVSLTSFPPRIQFVYHTIISLKQQSQRPYKIILWLSDEEFPEHEKDLPKKLISLQDDLFSIFWCKNIKSYKKLIPTLLKYPYDIIVTADDDIIYKKEWLEILYQTHCEYPKDIICHRVTKIIKDENAKWATIPGGYEYYSGTCSLNKLCGGSGTLYPIYSLYPDVINEGLFMKLAPTSDDIWFWLMGVLNGSKVRAAKNGIPKLNINKKTINTPALTQINDHEEKLFWVHFYNILGEYPILEQVLNEEYMERKGILDI